jgi:drug/metabolite transporter (DMT)-like permease
LIAELAPSAAVATLAPLAPRNWTGPLWAVLAALVWSGILIVLARLVGTITPPTLACVRFSFAALVLGAWLAARGQLPHLKALTRRERALLALAALGLAANYVFSMMALSYLTPAEASVLSQMNGMALLACGVLLLRERLSRAQAFGLVIFFCGLMLFLGPRLLGSAFDVRFLTGSALVAIGAVTWAAYAVVQRVTQNRLSSLQILWLVCCGSALALLPLSSAAGFERLDAGGWIALALASASTVVAYGAFALALQHWSLTGTTTVTSSTPVLTWLLSWAAAAGGVAGVAVPQVGTLGIVGALLVTAGCIVTSLGQAPPQVSNSAT